MTIAVAVDAPKGVSCVVTELWPLDLIDGDTPRTEHTIDGGCCATFHVWGDKQLLIAEITKET